MSRSAAEASPSAYSERRRVTGVSVGFTLRVDSVRPQSDNPAVTPRSVAELLCDSAWFGYCLLQHRVQYRAVDATMLKRTQGVDVREATAGKQRNRRDFGHILKGSNIKDQSIVTASPCGNHDARQGQR